jgi:hypothetical protein
MNIVISQPMFLPWAGLFEQIRLADVFVHYDDVPLPQGRSFISRVQVKGPKGQEWLTVPLVRRSRGLIREVRIDHSEPWKKEHLATFSRLLKPAPHFDEAWALLETIYDYDTQWLSQFNIHALEHIARYLGFAARFAKSSDLAQEGKSSEKLLKLVKHFHGTCYITGHGAKNYLNHDLFASAGVEVQYMDYRLEPYPQLHGEFTPYVTLIDGIAHLGKDVAKHMTSQTLHWKQAL